jgi:glycosyltransferase involved in cell wall biosynthesis
MSSPHERNDRVLFISHDASRTGAPMLLLHLLGWLKSHSSLRFEVLLGEDGELRPQFEAVASVSVAGGWRSGWSPGTLAGRVHRRRLLTRLRAERWGAIYANTIATGDILDALGAGRRPVICHVHELETMIRFHGPANFAALKRHVRRYIACSEAVKANLVDRHQLDPGAIDVVHEFIPLRHAAVDPSPQSGDRLRRELGISADALIVGASGTTDWRKGPDVFIQLARAVHLKRVARPVHFVWIGGASPGTYRFEELQHDIRAIGMEDRVHFIGARADALACFAVFDLFALVSREDPFPLVCLEAASLRKPIVCFAGAGGEPEFVEQDCGFVVPYLDIDAMADRVVTLLESAQLRAQCGDRAAEKVRSRHDINVAAPKILRAIESHVCAGFSKSATFER